VARNVGVGNIPQILQDPQTKAFRLNRPLDLWPAIALPPLPQPIDPATITTLVQKLRTTATGADSAAFEVAVCDAFSALGFHTQHIGGTGQPDGIFDAPLGTDGYRVILECKTAQPGNVVANPRPEEPAGFRAAFRGDYAIVVGPAFSGDATLDSELAAHNVALWDLENLIRILTAQIGPWEMRPLFAPGRVQRACDLLLWDRDHGARKRVAILCRNILEVGWRLQTTFAATMTPSEIPALTRDTLAALVDEALVNAGVTDGADLHEFDNAMALLLAQNQLVQSAKGNGSFIVPQAPTP
jgi:hypothetical protein